MNISDEDRTSIFCFGNAEMGQFKSDRPNEKKPIEIKTPCSLKVVKIVSGSMHSAILTETGEVYTWGVGDDGRLGREFSVTEENSPGKVELKNVVDLISAGESHTVCANSLTGEVYFFGKIKKRNGSILLKFEFPVRMGKNLFKRRGIKDIKSGSNHILILVGVRVYVFGDIEYGALGNEFKVNRSRIDLQDITSVDIGRAK